MKKEIDYKLLAKINLAALDYYQMAHEFKTHDNFNAWLQSLEDHPILRAYFERVGFENGKNAIPFMRYILEINNKELDEHMKAHLTQSEYQQWMNPSESVVVPTEMSLINSNDPSKLI